MSDPPKELSYERVIGRINDISWSSPEECCVAKKHIASVFSLGTTYANNHNYVLSLFSLHKKGLSQ